MSFQAARPAQLAWTTLLPALLVASATFAGEPLLLVPPLRGGVAELREPSGAPDERVAIDRLQRIWRSGRDNVDNVRELRRTNVRGPMLYRLDATPRLDRGGILRRYAKSLRVAPGGGKLHASEFGQPLEFVLIEDPTRAIGQATTLVVQLLFEREPLERASVKLWRVEADRTFEETTLKTDVNGRMSLPLPGDGAWALTARYEGTCDACGGDAEVLISTLLLDYREAQR